MLKDLIIVGAGGLGREIAWLVQRINAVHPSYNLLGFVDDADITETIKGYKVLGNRTWLKSLNPKPMVVCAIGNPFVRSQIVNDLSDFKFATLIDPSVVKSDLIQIGEGSIICANCILTTNITIGKHVIINLNCTVGHDTILDNFSSLMPGVIIAGKVYIKQGVYIGAGSTIIETITIDEWAIIGAGAAVVRDIQNHVTAVGVPAKILLGKVKPDSNLKIIENKIKKINNRILEKVIIYLTFIQILGKIDFNYLLGIIEIYGF
jgi:sugar O-acyltransferase (sialic acid O-acetyltransferase NeuD family)